MNSDIESFILNQERFLLDRNVRRSALQLDSIFDDNFLEFGSSGTVYTKHETIQALLNEAPNKAVYGMEDFKVCPLSQDIVLATYKTFMINAAGQSINTLRSSIWKEIGGA